MFDIKINKYTIVQCGIVFNNHEKHEKNKTWLAF